MTLALIVFIMFISYYNELPYIHTYRCISGPLIKISVVTTIIINIITYYNYLL
jgi:hypothetical protein